MLYDTLITPDWKAPARVKQSLCPERPVANPTQHTYVANSDTAAVTCHLAHQWLSGERGRPDVCCGGGVRDCVAD